MGHGGARLALASGVARFGEGIEEDPLHGQQRLLELLRDRADEQRYGCEREGDAAAAVRPALDRDGCERGDRAAEEDEGERAAAPAREAARIARACETND